MIWLNPQRVTFDGELLTHVESVSVDRVSNRTVIEHGDLGPHAVFVDAPEQRSVINVVRRVLQSEQLAVLPGDSGSLTFDASSSSGDVGNVSVTADAVVTGVKYAVSSRQGTTQTISLIAVSSDGVVDPITSSVTGGSS